MMFRCITASFASIAFGIWQKDIWAGVFVYGVFLIIEAYHQEWKQRYN